MENEEKKELQAEAPKPARPRKREKLGFDAEAPKKEEVKVVRIHKLQIQNLQKEQTI